MADTQPPRFSKIRLSNQPEGKNKLYNQTRRFTIDWNDLVLAENYLTELESVSLYVVEYLLGYLPPKAIILPQEAFLRTLTNDLKYYKITNEELLEMAEPHVKLIRNADIGDHADPVYEDKYLWKYEMHLREFKERARQRLAGFLGYEPDLQHSMISEIHLRTAMASDDCSLPDGELTAKDLRFITVIKYREVLLKDGREAADNSPLPAIEVIARQIANKKL